MPRGRPNLLLVMADQMSALATGPYGNCDVLTPQLDQLASSGVVFENAYCNSPLCVPSRASMLTGALGSDVHVNDNGEPLAASVPTFVHHLRRGGYETVLSGKMHLIGPDQLHGFERRLTTDIYPADFLWTPSWPRLRELVDRVSSTSDTGPLPPHRRLMAAALRRSGPARQTEQLAYDNEVQFRALEWLRGASARREGRPWFLCVSYTHPHDPYIAPQNCWDRYEGRKIALPPAPPPCASPPHPSDAWLNIHHGLDVVRPAPDEVYRSRRGYYASTTFVDDRVGELLRELQDQGLAEDTVVLFTSDHGDQCGEHGMWFKRTCREWSARVPLLVAGRGVPAGRRVAANVSLVDLFPTLLDLAGQTLPAGYDTFAPRLAGESLAPWFAPQTPDPRRTDITFEYSGDGTFEPIRALVSERMKLILTHGAPDQLYDLGRDPDEWCNVAADPAYGDVVAALRGRILAGWDPDAAEREALRSQRRRIFLNEALYQGAPASWDYQPLFDAGRMYSRPNRDRHWASLVYERVLIDSSEQRDLLEDQGLGSG